MAMVTVMFGGETVGSYTIKHHPFIIGRDSKNEIHIDNIGVSRQHCQFVYADNHFNIEDLGSANGTILHGQKIRMAPIRDGDEIQMGKYTLIFHQAPGEGAPPPKGGASGPAPTEVATEGPPSKAEGFSDNIRTMMVDGAKLQQQIGQSSSPQRASDVASKFAGGQPSAGKGSALWILIVLLGLVVVGLVGAVVFLVLKKG